MNIEIILIGILVGIANFASRFGPFFVIQKFQQGSQKRGALWLKIALVRLVLRQSVQCSWLRLCHHC